MVLILLPGLDGTGTLFDRFIADCPEELSPQVVAYPGDRKLGYLELEPIVKQQLPRDSPFVIIAESFSGPLAVILGSRSIPNLRAVVLAASFVTPPALRLWRYLPWNLLFRLSVPMLVLRPLFPGADAALAREMREAVRKVSPSVLAARVRSALSVDVREYLATVPCPMLYIQATRDLVVSRKCLSDILSIREDATVEQLDSHHPVLQLSPSMAWEVIERFLSRVQAD
jgi:pimeloyl-ACP methyl ester carboxylesterase